ncbi:hypothetical protein [Amycolatopsis sp. NPDC051371]|uniref:hypothetical protein n=1 Tax=Amycolatopsis sp. NPDC051371 TaxID=3155800 RepID=UPI00341D4D29
MTTSTVHIEPGGLGESAYDRACQLIETELGGRRITPEPENWTEQQDRTRRHKTALITAVSKKCLVDGVVDACRLVEAVYPCLDADGLCTDTAVTAAWNIIAPEAHTWPKQRQAESRRFTGECLARAITEANTGVA